MRIVLVLLMLCAGCLPVATKRPAPVPVPTYPLAGTYAAWRGDSGRVLVHDDAVDTAQVRELARFSYVILEPARDSLHVAALRLLKSMNPRMTLLAYLPVGGYFVCGWGWHGQTPAPYGCDTTTMAWSIYRAVGEKGSMFNRSGEPFMVSQGIGIDYAQPGVAAALAESLAAWVAASGCFDGAFLDGACSSILWMAGGFDYERAGFATLAAWDSAYRDGMVRFPANLRARLGDHFGLVGNCGPVGVLAYNGWMAENWPHQNPASWAAWDSVLAWADTAYAAPRLSWITTMRNGRSQDDPTLQRDWRFGLGSATLHDHVVHALVGTKFDPLRGFLPWWCPELDSDLGLPLGPAYRMGSVHRRDFQRGTVLVNPTAFPARVLVGDSTVVVPPMDAIFPREVR